MAEELPAISFNAEPSFMLAPYNGYTTFGGSLKLNVQKDYHGFGVLLLNVKDNYVKSNLKLIGGFVNYSLQKWNLKEVVYIYPELFLGYASLKHIKYEDANTWLTTIEDEGDEFLLGGFGVNYGIGYKRFFFTLGYKFMFGSTVSNLVSAGVRAKVKIR